MRNVWYSFNRNIGRILAYIVVGLLITLLSSYLNMGVVHAHYGPTNIEQLNLPSYANFYSTTQVDKFSPVSMHSVRYHDEESTTDVAVMTAYETFDMPYKQGLGGGVGFNVSQGFVKDGYYTVGIIVRGLGTASNQIHYAHTHSFDVGVCNNVVCTFNYTTKALTKAHTTQNTLTFLWTGSQFRLHDFNALYVTFKAPRDGNYIFIPFNTLNSGTATFQFVGYTYSSHGFNSSVAIQQSEQIINSNINKASQDIQKKVEDQTNKIDNSIKDTDTSGAQGDANSFFEDFENKDYGLTDVITMPLQIINNITNGTCTPLSVPVPFVNQNITLPCMYQIYEEHFGGFLQIYQVITFGVISYWVCINLFRMVKNFKNPDNDEVEVFDL